MPARPMVVVIDDDAAYVGMMVELLGDEGYRVESCASEHEALSCIDRYKPDVVILDIRIEKPDSGWRVLQRMRLHREIKHIPVIVCSADAAFLREKAERIRTQNSDVLEKPFDLDEMLVKIREALARRQG